MITDHSQDDLLVVIGLTLYVREFEDAEPANVDRA